MNGLWSGSLAFEVENEAFCSGVSDSHDLSIGSLCSGSSGFQGALYFPQIGGPEYGPQ